MTSWKEFGISPKKWRFEIFQVALESRWKLSSSWGKWRRKKVITRQKWALLVLPWKYKIWYIRFWIIRNNNFCDTMWIRQKTKITSKSFHRDWLLLQSSSLKFSHFFNKQQLTICRRNQNNFLSISLFLVPASEW